MGVLRSTGRQIAHSLDNPVVKRACCARPDEQHRMIDVLARTICAQRPPHIDKYLSLRKLHQLALY